MNSVVKNTLLACVIVFIFLFLIKVLDVSYPLTITNTNRSSELSVVGEGKTDAVPDKAVVNVGITVQDVSTVAEAQRIINETNNKLIQAMKKLRIPASDIKTSNYSINPSYSGEPNQGINGYNGNASTTITVKNTALVSQVLVAATDAGANEVHGVSYSIEDPNKYREEARNKAIENAKEQAEKLAKTLGIKLGKITNIVEASPDNVYPLYRAAESAAVGIGGTADIQPGTQTITSTVTLYFEKK